MITPATLSREDLSRIAAKGAGVSHAVARDAVNLVLGLMCKALASGEDVKIRNFGTFKLRDKDPRMGRNPKTMATFEIPARRVCTFRASEKLVATMTDA